MDIDSFSKEISQIHIDYAKLLSKVASNLSASGEQGVLLWLNQRNCDTYAIDVINHFGLTPGRVANIIKKLEQRGYIQRIQDSEDLRKARILLTELGETYSDELYTQMNISHRHLIESLGEKDSAEWVRLIRRLIVIAENNPDSDCFK